MNNLEWLDLLILPLIALLIALERHARRTGQDSTQEWIDERREDNQVL